MNKIDINLEVTAALTEIIKHTKTRWCNNIRSFGVTKSDFLSQQIPSTKIIQTANMSNLIGLFASDGLMAEKFDVCSSVLNAESLRTAIAYMPMSHMPWHTDHDLPGTRIYYTFTTGEGIFRYKNEDGEIIEDYDNIGWTARKFVIRDGVDPLWHAVWTEKIRFSFGFKLIDVQQEMV